MKLKIVGLLILLVISLVVAPQFGPYYSALGAHGWGT